MRDRHSVSTIFLCRLFVVCLLYVCGFQGMAYAQYTGRKMDTALEAAVEAKKTAQVRRLLAQGADPNAEGALCAAAGNEDPAMVAILLAHGARVNRRGSDGQTALHRAALYGLSPADLADFYSQGDVSKQRSPMREVMRLLIARGADVNAADTEGRTPLMLVAAYAQSPACVRLLLAHGANVQAKDHNGWTALRYAQFGAEHSWDEKTVNREVISLLRQAREGTRGQRHGRRLSLT